MLIFYSWHMWADVKRSSSLELAEVKYHEKHYMYAFKSEKSISESLFLELNNLSLWSFVHKIFTFNLNFFPDFSLRKYFSSFRQWQFFYCFFYYSFSSNYICVWQLQNTVMRKIVLDYNRDLCWLRKMQQQCLLLLITTTTIIYWACTTYQIFFIFHL